MPRGCKLYDWNFENEQVWGKFPNVRVVGYSKLKGSEVATSPIFQVTIMGGGKYLKVFTTNGRYYWLDKKDEGCRGWSQIGKAADNSSDGLSRDTLLLLR